MEIYKKEKVNEIIKKIHQNSNLTDGSKLNEIFLKNVEIKNIFEITENNLNTLKTLGILFENENLNINIKTYFLTNIVLSSRYKNLLTQNDILKKNIKEKNLVMPFNNNISYNFSIKKRKRKRKNEVDRNFKCVIPGCDKAYGSENSLNQHIKLKHQEFWNRLKNHDLQTIEGILHDNDDMIYNDRSYEPDIFYE